MQKRKSTKRVKRVFNFKPIFIVLTIINLFLGLNFSTITSVRAVRVLGAPSSDHNRMAQHLQKLKGRPMIRVCSNSIESLILENQELKEVSLTRNIFGRATLYVKPFYPIAQIEPFSNLYLSEEGTIFQKKKKVNGLVKIRIPEHFRFINFSFSGGSNLKLISFFCHKVRKMTLSNQWGLELDGRGVISLKKEKGPRIIFGGSERIIEKLDQMNVLLNKNPNLLDEIEELNLISYENPTILKKEEFVRS